MCNLYLKLILIIFRMLNYFFFLIMIDVEICFLICFIICYVVYYCCIEWKKKLYFKFMRVYFFFFGNI